MLSFLAVCRVACTRGDDVRFLKKTADRISGLESRSGERSKNDFRVKLVDGRARKSRGLASMVVADRLMEITNNSLNDTRVTQRPINYSHGNRSVGEASSSAVANRARIN